jgi:ankyrin repeat protein
MKTKFLILIVLVVVTVARAQTSNLTALLQQGLLEEQANGNLNAAIANYKTLAEEFDKNRQLAATAVFRLGECYRAQGKTNEAVAQYQRVIHEFSDMETLATMSRQNLTGLGVALADAGPTAVSTVNATLTDAAPDEDGEIQRIQQLMRNSPNLVDSGELDKAARSGELRVAAFLLDHGRNVNGTYNGTPPLCTAADAGQKTMVELLLGRGAEVDARDGTGATALLRATADGFQAVVEVLLAHKADANAQFTRMNSLTPLHIAAQRGHANLIKLLLTAGANANVEDAEDRTPLSHAAEQGNVEIEKLLLAAKADPNAGKAGAPLLFAIFKHDVASAELLLSDGANPSAPSRGYWMPNRGNFVTWTPLTTAIESSQLPMVKLLLKYKAEIDKSAQTEGYLAEAIYKPDILEALLDAGANPNARGWQGDTALIQAARNARDPVFPTSFEELLDHHADPNERNDSGETPLIVLSHQAYTNALEIASQLRKYGAIDYPPSWDRIEVNRISGKNSYVVFREGSNTWNRFTLLEVVLNYYMEGFLYRHPVPVPEPPVQLPTWTHPFPGSVPMPRQRGNTMAFPDLARVVIVRPTHDSTNETRITVDLLNATNGVDCSKDAPLDFGDMVEISERDHPLGEPPSWLSDDQISTMINCLHGTAHLLVHGQKAELPLDPYSDGPFIFAVLRQSSAQQLLLASSDLSRVKVTRHDPKTGAEQHWTLDCRTASAPDLWLRDGDIIEVPEK